MSRTCSICAHWQLLFNSVPCVTNSGCQCGRSFPSQHWQRATATVLPVIVGTLPGSGPGHPARMPEWHSGGARSEVPRDLPAPARRILIARRAPPGFGSCPSRSSRRTHRPVTRYCVSVRPNHSGFPAWLFRQGQRYPGAVWARSYGWSR